MLSFTRIPTFNSCMKLKGGTYMKRIVCSSSTGHRVVQISIDLEIPARADLQQFIDEIESKYQTSDQYNIVGVEVTEDLTDIYEKDYSNLLIF